MSASPVANSVCNASVLDRVVQIWTEVLAVNVAADETFLDMGGDSLAAMSCIVRLREAFGVEFTTDDFLTNESTVTTFANRIAQRT